MKIIAVILLFVATLPACTDNSKPASSAAAQPAPKAESFQAKSAAELRRGIASTTPASKGSITRAEPTSNVYYTCDRNELPRTCCYYLTNNGGGIYGSMSCTEENH